VYKLIFNDFVIADEENNLIANWGALVRKREAQQRPDCIQLIRFLVEGDFTQKCKYKLEKERES